MIADDVNEVNSQHGFGRGGPPIKDGDKRSLRVMFKGDGKQLDKPPSRTSG